MSGGCKLSCQSEQTHCTIFTYDHVILPSLFNLVAPTSYIAQLTAKTPQLSFLNAALKTTGLDRVFFQNGTFTVFAPVNAAFTPDVQKILLADKDLLVRVLKYHVVGSVLPSTSIADGSVATVYFGREWFRSCLSLRFWLFNNLVDQ